jgi:hypothetical protein
MKKEWASGPQDPDASVFFLSRRGAVLWGDFLLWGKAGYLTLLGDPVTR